LNRRDLPLPRMATQSPSANRERSSGDVHVAGRVRALALRSMRTPSPDARELASTSPGGEVFRKHA
jgi:hypothetical protein